VASSRERILPTDWSPDGRFLLFRALTVTGSLDVAVLPMEPGPGRERTPIPFLRTGANESNAVFSPDGRFVAYESDESGVTEVYVRPFDPENPEASGAGPGKVTVSRNGGTRPQWDLSGKALSYVTADLKRWSVDVSLTPTLRVDEPQPLGEFPRGVATITPDGQRVLIGTPVGSQPQSATVVLNWRAGLK
jgi:Tol biopolymer transport system component